MRRRRPKNPARPRPQTRGGFRVAYEFPGIGRRVLRLNARRVIMEGTEKELILLAFEGATRTARGEAP